MNLHSVDLTEPDPNIEYECDYFLKSKGFTHLMKLVLSVRKSPNAMLMIREIITNCPEELDKQNELGYSALMLASNYCEDISSIECVELLLKAGANVNLTNVAVYGETALIKATCECGPNCISSVACVKLLINYKADVNILTNMKRTALMEACDISGAYTATDCINLLIEAGTDLNIQDCRGYTALMLLCNNCYTDDNGNLSDSIKWIELLLNAGADCNIQNHTGDTALIYLCQYFDSDQLDPYRMLLLNVGSDVNLQNISGNTALMLYCRDNDFSTGNTDVLLSLISSCNDVIMTNNNSKSAYDYFIKNSTRMCIDNEYFELLLKGEISINNIKSANKCYLIK